MLLMKGQKSSAAKAKSARSRTMLNAMVRSQLALLGAGAAATLKGPLPRSTTRALEVAIYSLPVRTPWPAIDEEAWWCDVLADRRLRRSSAKALSEKDQNAGQRLDRLPVKSLTFSCAWCGQRTVIKVAELIRMFGRDRNVRTIGRQPPRRASRE